MQNVGGAELPYLYYEGEAPPILFAHATGFLPWLWHPVIEELAPPSQVWVPYICNYRECDPEKGGLKLGYYRRGFIRFLPLRRTLKIIWQSVIR